MTPRRILPGAFSGPLKTFSDWVDRYALLAREHGEHSSIVNALLSAWAMISPGQLIAHLERASAAGGKTPRYVHPALQEVCGRAVERGDLSSDGRERYDFHVRRAQTIFDEHPPWPRLTATIRVPEHAEAFRIPCLDRATLWVVVDGHEERGYLELHPPTGQQSVHEVLLPDDRWGPGVF